MDIEALAKFPLQDEDDWIMTVLIGGILLFVGFLIVPILFVWGYAVEVMRGGVEGTAEPPQFDDWGDLAVDGLKALVIVVAYQIVPAIVGIGTIVLFGALGAGTDSGALGAIGIVFGVGAWMVLGFVFGYVGMAGLVNFAVEDTLGAGFDFGTIATVATTGGWLKAWAFYIGLSIVAGIAGSVTGGIASPFTSFYALSAGSRAFGEAFASATGVEGPTDQATATASA